MIPNDTAKQLGKDFTEKHPATVLGIAKQCIKLRPGFHVTSTKVKAVRSNGIEVSLTCCRGDLCEMKKTQKNISGFIQKVLMLPTVVR